MPQASALSRMKASNLGCGALEPLAPRAAPAAPSLPSCTPSQLVEPRAATPPLRGIFRSATDGSSRPCRRAAEPHRVPHAIERFSHFSLLVPSSSRPDPRPGAAAGPRSLLATRLAHASLNSPPAMDGCVIGSEALVGHAWCPVATPATTAATERCKVPRLPRPRRSLLAHSAQRPPVCLPGRLPACSICE
jgi:hypothetical protein